LRKNLTAKPTRNRDFFKKAASQEVKRSRIREFKKARSAGGGPV
jgi:hypothetical protein